MKIQQNFLHRKSYDFLVIRNADISDIKYIEFCLYMLYSVSVRRKVRKWLLEEILAKELCTKLSVLNVEKNVKSHSNQLKDAQFIAKNVLERKEDSKSLRYFR